MTDISGLEGINSEEVDKLCHVGVRTLEDFLALLTPDFNAGITNISGKTGVKADRLIQLAPPDWVPTHLLPDEWIEGVAKRLLREPPLEDAWLKRCRFGLQRFGRGLRGHWRGWRKNLPILVFSAGLLLVLVMFLRAAGHLQWLPSPLGLRDRALVTVDSLPSEKSDRVLRADDLYSALLPFESDYFRPGDNIEGLVLARSVSAHTPLRFRDVLRHQVITVKDIQAGAVIQKEDIALAWTIYQPGSELKLEKVCGRKTSHAIRKDGAVLSEFLEP